MFSLDQCKAKLLSVNPRAERHGEDMVMAADIKLEVRVANDLLSEFDPYLKGALYKKPEAVDLINDPSYLPVLRFPDMGPIRWEYEGAGYTLIVARGLLSDLSITLEDCKVDKITFHCQDGGHVLLGLRVIAHPSASKLGEICEMIQQTIDIELTEPTLDGADEQDEAA